VNFRRSDRTSHPSHKFLTISVGRHIHDPSEVTTPAAERVRLLRSLRNPFLPTLYGTRKITQTKDALSARRIMLRELFVRALAP
jgi:hypothetical protein